MRLSPRWVAILAAAGTTSAFASTTVYTDSVTFLSTLLAGSYTEGFTVATGGVYNSPLSFSGGDFSYQVSTPTVAVGVYRSTTFLGNTYEAESLTITFTGGGATAIGGNFYLTNQADAFQAQPVTLTLSDGTTSTFTPTSASVGSYVGFVSTLPITSLVISAPALLQFNALDNITVGVTSAVPEAGTLALMALGMGWLVVRRRYGH